MCLRLQKSARQRTARKDIPILKAVERQGNVYQLVVGYVTPYTHTRIPKDGLLIAYPTSKHIPIHRSTFKSLKNYRFIKQGAIHCYKDTTNRYLEQDELYLKGIIPKDVKYYYNSEAEEYAAQRIQLDMSEAFTYEQLKTGHYVHDN